VTNYFKGGQATAAKSNIPALDGTGIANKSQAAQARRLKLWQQLAA